MGLAGAERSCHVCAPPRSSPRILSLALFGSSRLPLSSPAAPSSAPSLMATLPRLSRKDPGDSVRPARITWHGLPLSRNGPHGHSGVSVTTWGREGKGPRVRVHIGHAARALVLLWTAVPAASKAHPPGEPTEVPCSARRRRSACHLASETVPGRRPPRPAQRSQPGAERRRTPAFGLSFASRAAQRTWTAPRARRGGGTWCAGSAACPATARCPPRAASGSPRRSPRNPHCPCPPPAAGHAVLTGRDPRNQATDSPLAKEVASER